MKKLFAVLLAVLFVLTPAAAIHYDDYDTAKVWMNKGAFYVCFDSYTLIGPRGQVSQYDIYGPQCGSANVVINSHPIYLTDETAIVCYGWSGLIDGSVKTAVYGYKLNEGAPVFDSDFTREAEQAVYNAGGDSRFCITVSFENTSAPMLITLLSKGSDGVVRDLIEFSVNGEYISSESSRIPPQLRMFGNIEKSKLNVVISGGTEIFPALPGREFTAEIRFVNNIHTDRAELLIRYDPGMSFVGAEFTTDKQDTASAVNDPATRTLRLSWSSAAGMDDDFTLAKLVFKTDADQDSGFLHISTDKEMSAVYNGQRSLSFNAVNGGADAVPYLWGDVDGDEQTVNKDVVLLFRFASETESEINETAADVNGDGEINNKDVITLFRVLSGSAEADLSYALKQPKFSQTTESVKNIRSWTFNDGAAGNVIGIYCETEPGAEVLVCDGDGTVLLREHALNTSFFGRFILPENKTSQKVYIYAKADRKGVSKSSRAYTLEYGGSVGSGAIIGKDSHVFLNYYRAHYTGQAALPENQAEGRMNYIKGRLYDKLAEVRARTGKNTKIIILVCTNPAAIYHGLQYSEEEKGWGDYNEPTSVTQFGEFMKDDENVYMIDMRQILSEHTDELLFMQADSHWTQIAAYYGYYLAAQKIKGDFPDTKVYDLNKDFNVHEGLTGGDLLNFMGAHGAAAYSASVTPKSSDMKAPSNAPTAYVMGDSYYGAFASFLDLMFSRVYLNQFEYQAHPPLYNYVLDDLESKKPDYLFYIWTERNVDTSLSWFESAIVGEAR